MAQKRLYDLKVGSKVFRNLASAVIVKNIKNNKLLPDHLISAAGKNSWTPLKHVPALATFFGGDLLPEIKVNPNLFQLRKEGEITSNLSRGRLIDLIRKFELGETDEIRNMGSKEWLLAGDDESLTRYFDMRRKGTGDGTFKAAVDTGTPFYRDFAAPVRYFATSRYVFNVIAILIMIGIAELVKIPLVAGPIMVMTGFYIYAYYFRAINAAANGKMKFPEFPDISDFAGELVRPSVQFFLTRAVATAPLLAYLSFFKMKGIDFLVQAPILYQILNMPWIVLIEKFPRFETVSFGGFGDDAVFEGMEFAQFAGWEYLGTNIFVIICLLFLFLYFPIALLRQASYGEFMPTFNVIGIVGSVVRAFPQFLMLVVFIVSAEVMTVLSVRLLEVLLRLRYVQQLFAEVQSASMHAQIFLPILLNMVVYVLVMTFNFLKMFYIGRFLYQNQQRMGWE